MLLFRLVILSAAVFFAAPHQQSSSVKDGIAKIRLDWARDLHEKRLDELTMLYAPDAVFLQPDGQRITGRPAIRELCKNIMAMFTSNLTFRSINTESSGNLAYDSGEFDETLTKIADGSKSKSRGSYLMIFKRQADGNWLIAQQMWSGTEPDRK